ncbi:MAG: DUF4149 domain-containing protein [Nitrospiraceae bacterium]|nr:DUF4149 domain-containing protein [Nitrospiraceae bacterium]
MVTSGDFRVIWFVFFNITLALWTGGIGIFTFLATPAIFKSFPRDTASSIVDKLFPLYFPYNLITSFFALVFFLASGGGGISVALIAVAVLANLFIVFILYPSIKKTKREIASFEKTDPSLPARKRFSRMHAVSAVLNLLLLALGLTLIVIQAAG